MFDRLNDTDIANALNELIAFFGVKEEAPLDDLLRLLRKGDAEGCAQQVARWLDLPIRISLSYVPEGFSSGGGRFHSTALTRSEQKGHGVNQITAQIDLPSSLPPFGSSDLEAYPIRVHVSEKCHESPHTFVTVMAHELSHVLLAAVHHPKRHSELHTDLLPIVLGFRDVVRQGRKLICKHRRGNLTTISVTTYGYLTDVQFDFAFSYIAEILLCRQRNKRLLVKLIAQVRSKLRTATWRLLTFRNHLAYLDAHRGVKIKQEDIRRIVVCHAPAYARDLETGIAAARISVDKAENFAWLLNHFTGRAVEQLHEHTTSLELASRMLNSLIDGIGGDLQMLRRYVALRYRVWEYFHHQLHACWSVCRHACSRVRGKTATRASLRNASPLLRTSA